MLLFAEILSFHFLIQKQIFASSETVSIGYHKKSSTPHQHEDSYPEMRGRKKLSHCSTITICLRLLGSATTVNLLTKITLLKLPIAGVCILLFISN